MDQNTLGYQRQSHVGTRLCITFQTLVTLIALIFLLNVTSTNTDHIHWNRRPTVKGDKLKVITDHDCKVYLCKYGYLNCNCSMYLKLANRSKRSIIIPVEQQEPDRSDNNQILDSLAVLTTPNRQACTTSHFKKGFEQFQKLYRLQVTGTCDARTKDFMSRSRCGQPDVFNVDKLLDRETERKETVSLMNILSRSSQLEQTLERRKQLLAEYLNMQTGDSTTYGGGRSIRTKKSVIDFHVNDFNGFMSKTRITWRLMSAYTSPFIPIKSQIAVLTNAFRMWSEVSPLCFAEDKNSPQVDVEIGFLEGTHLNCVKRFDGVGGEIAHKFITDVHFDKTEPYTTDSASLTAINLQLVAVHEIGHVLGFNHTALQGSVMNAIYQRDIRGSFELSDFDRSEIRRTYGPCSGSFDLLFDLVKTVNGQRIFNTYFFRGNNFWMYENKNKRPRYGDPLTISTSWNGLPSNIDAYFHFFETDTSNNNAVIDEYYFIKGDRYYRYNINTDSVMEQGLSTTKFRAGPLGSIPVNLDAAFYEFLSKRIFFFKGDTVYKYAYKPTGNHSCCTDRPQKIVELFPPKTPADLRAPNGDSYSSSIDSIYLSWTPPYTLYLVKGNYIWTVEGYSVYGPYKEENLRAKYSGQWNEVWHYVCDASCP